jgi:hypothetical protein
MSRRSLPRPRSWRLDTAYFRPPTIVGALSAHRAFTAASAFRIPDSNVECPEMAGKSRMVRSEAAVPLNLTASICRVAGSTSYYRRQDPHCRCRRGLPSAGVDPPKPSGASYQLHTTRAGSGNCCITAIRPGSTPSRLSPMSAVGHQVGPCRDRIIPASAVFYGLQREII